MAKKSTSSNKNYKNMSYSKSKTTTSNNTKTKKKTNTSGVKKENNLKTTTRIRIDNERLNDVDSLDTSFLEKRISGKSANKIIKKDTKVTDKDTRRRNTRRNISNKKKVDKTLVISVFIIVVIGVLITFAFFSLVNLITGSFKTKTVVKTETVTKKVVKNVMDENIVFLGDSITSLYKLDKYYDTHNVINSGISGDCTKDVMNSLKDRVFIYNPSKVFILIGTNDIGESHNDKYDEDTTIDNIKTIIEDIKKNRKFAEIYIESIYPINNSDDEKINHTMVGIRDNDKITKLNKRIKKLAKEENINYINIYDELLDEDGLLNLDYTTDGLHVNDNGYEVITEIINKYL